MRNFGRKNGWKNMLESKPLLILLFIIVLVFGWSVFGFWGKMRETAKNKVIAENKIAELRKQKAELSSNIASLKTDAGLEDSIRDKFGLGKDGEGLIVIVDDKEKA